MECSRRCGSSDKPRRLKAFQDHQHCAPSIIPFSKPKKDFAGYNELVDAINQMRTDFVPAKPEHRSDKTQFDETEVIVLSDLHFGKKVELPGPDGNLEIK